MVEVLVLVLQWCSIGDGGGVEVVVQMVCGGRKNCGSCGTISGCGDGVVEVGW